MKMFKKAVLGAAMALAFSGAQASMINVGGVSWDPDSPFDFTGKYDFVQWFNGTELTGLGEFYKLNNTNTNVFVPNGELTLQFGGFNLGQSGFSNGWLNIYVGSGITDDYDAGLTPTNVTKATNGNLWLSLVAKSNQFVSDIPNSTNPYLSGQLTVNWDVIQNVGAAWSNLDTNGQAQGTDIFSRASATFDFVDSSLGPVALLGNGSLSGNSIPEPASLALVGLGLLGAGALRRRKVAAK